MAQQTILVVGGALAGPTAAARAREINEDARIVLIERNRHVSYAQCGLAYHLSGEVPSMEDLNRERADFFRSVYNIEVMTETEAVKLDPARRALKLRRADAEETLAYDALVFALGAASRRPEGVAGDNLVCFRTLDDLESIRRVIRTRGPRVAVLGGGPMGLEAADGLARGGADVTLIERQPQLLPRFGARAAAVARRALERKARVITGATVSAFDSNGRVTSLRLSTGERLAVDLVVSSTGLVPRTRLLRDAGAKLAPDGTVPIDESAATSLPHVYACGVCVSLPQAITGRLLWSPQGALADKTAQIAGANAAGGKARLGPALGSMLVRALDVILGRTGLTLPEAQAHFGTGDVGVTTIYAPSHERYYPGAALLLLQLFWRRDDGRVLGVEVAGESGVDKRIDAAAAAIASGLTVESVGSLDFDYEPPFNAARDPLNVAATLAAFERAGLGRAIEPEDLAARLAEVQVIDVRSEAGDGFAPLPGAKLIPLETLRRDLGQLDRTRPVVTVSRGGRRGWLAARILLQHGFSSVMNLAGGLRAWSLLETRDEQKGAQQ